MFCLFLKDEVQVNLHNLVLWKYSYVVSARCIIEAVCWVLLSFGTWNLEGEQLCSASKILLTKTFSRKAWDSFNDKWKVLLIWINDLTWRDVIGKYNLYMARKITIYVYMVNYIFLSHKCESHMKKMYNPQNILNNFVLKLRWT